MNWLVYHIVSGQSFFSGIALLIFAALASISPWPIVRRFTVLAFLLGLVAVLVSSTAIPYAIYALSLAVTLFWIASRFTRKWCQPAAYSVVVVWLLAGCYEIPYSFSPTFTPAKDRTMTIIGDSVSAGIGGEDRSETWPEILAREHSLQIQNISQVGETAGSALKHVREHKIASAVVLVEIGGNDLLGSTTPAQFERDLHGLLATLSVPYRQVVMFELPLPPFYHEYGRIQRNVAGKHGVQLIPKRVFLSANAGGDSTLDTIHLSPSGHQRMADAVWRIVEPGFNRQ